MSLKHILILSAIAFISCGQGKKDINSETTQEQGNLTIAFGSCAHSYDSLTIFDQVVSHDPALWIWLGDIMYGDSHDMGILKEKYTLQKEKPEYKRLISSSEIIGIWDDHDYGVNDGGKNYSMKDESKELLLEFLDVSVDNPVREHHGVYSEYDIAYGEKLVKVILLDTRYFRDTLDPDFESTARYIPNETGDILGAEQWAWLEDVLRKSKADFHIVGSGIQFIAEEQGYEKWANFPKSRKRMLDLLVKLNPKPLLFISGDRHIAELSKMNLEGLTYPLYDFTSSGLTHTWGMYWAEPNQYRVDSLIAQKNFGLIEVDWEKGNPSVILEVRGEQDELIQQTIIDY